MSQTAFYQYLFDQEVLFRLPAEETVGNGAAPESSTEREEKPVKRESVDEIASGPFSQLKSRLLIVVNTYGKGIKPEELAFLTKVMKAVKYDVADVDLMELDKIGPADGSVLVTGNLADYVLLFGVKPEMLRLNLHLALYEPQQKGGTWFLMSNSLLRIEMEESKRRDLWNALKKMFLG